MQGSCDVKAIETSIDRGKKAELNGSASGMLAVFVILKPKHCNLVAAQTFAVVRARNFGVPDAKPAETTLDVGCV